MAQSLLIFLYWGCSSVGRAPALQAGGHRFDPVHLHHSNNIFNAVWNSLTNHHTENYNHMKIYFCTYDISSDESAFSGCLGTKRRWRTWYTAISPGELWINFDPGISEWGNPPFTAFYIEYIDIKSKPGELKHLSSQRKGYQPILR